MSEWIEIKEGCRLPEPAGEESGYRQVLVYSPRHPEQHLGRYRDYDSTWTFIGSNSDWSKHITHWMPIPAPPLSEDKPTEGQ